MPELKGASVLLVLLVCFAGCDGCAFKPELQQDLIWVKNVPDGALVRAMVDGDAKNALGVFAPVNDSIFTGREGGNVAMMGIGNFQRMSPRTTSRDVPLPASNEIVVFCPKRAPVLISDFEYSSPVDLVVADLRPPVKFGVKVWLTGNARAGMLDVSRDTAKSIWDREGVGADFASFEYLTARHIEGQLTFSEFSNASDARAQDRFIAAYRYDPDVVNVYILSTVLGSNSMAHYFKKTIDGHDVDFIVMGSVPGRTLLVHELGHAFGLEHSDSFPSFDRYNVMAERSDSRQYFTEGQIFRAHAKAESLLYRKCQTSLRWPAREILSAHGLSPFEYTFDKPPLCRRLVPDGTLTDCGRPTSP